MPKTFSDNEHIEQATEAGRKVATEATRAGADIRSSIAVDVDQAYGAVP